MKIIEMVDAHCRSLTIGQVWSESFGEPMYPEGNKDTDDLMACPVDTPCGMAMLFRYSLMVHLMHEFDDHHAVVLPLLQALRAQMEIHYFG